MATTEITKETLNSTLDQEGIVLLDFWADWCGPCKQFSPVYEQASEENDDLTFGKIDTEAQQELASGFGITSIPTLMVFRDGIGVFQQAGALPKQGLDQVIQAVRDLDMEDVRRQVAEQQAQAQAQAQENAQDQ